MSWPRTLIGALGIALVAAALLGVWSGWETLGWRRASAEVLSRDVATSVLAPGSRVTDSLPAIHVRYRYVVARQAYLGSALVRVRPSRLDARLAALRPGATITIFHARAQPWRSTLVRGVGPAHWLALLGGLLLLSVAVHTPRRRRALPAPRLETRSAA